MPVMLRMSVAALLACSFRGIKAETCAAGGVGCNPEDDATGLLQVRGGAAAVEGDNASSADRWHGRCTCKRAFPAGCRFQDDAAAVAKFGKSTAWLSDLILGLSRTALGLIPDAPQPLVGRLIYKHTNFFVRDHIYFSQTVNTEVFSPLAQPMKNIWSEAVFLLGLGVMQQAMLTVVKKNLWKLSDCGCVAFLGVSKVMVDMRNPKKTVVTFTYANSLIAGVIKGIMQAYAAGVNKDFAPGNKAFPGKWALAAYEGPR